ncbi:AraC family transcriptional regulator [Poseidonocella sp. HB161398]|uniref:helix-turn-helix transcriptional regulator n=1 Tax=Poseidonocella sp. HB161398 TaxID=2320855 RepID=UPI00148707A6|nr:AraC family transcriptional regulator [Poseidonocella sp. HB161398]
MKDFQHPAPETAFLEALRRYRRPQLAGSEPHGPGLFSYCALERERLVSVVLPHPVLAVLLSGRKEIWRGLDQDCLTPGTLFALPGGVELDIVNEPDPVTGSYQSLILEITPEMHGGAPAMPAGRASAGPAIPLRPDLAEAVVHAAAAIAAGPASGAVRQARRAELLALLAGEPAARPLFALSVAERAAQEIRARPGAPWRAAEMARLLGLSESTLRRRLRGEGCSFAALLRRERMQAAARLIGQGLSSGAAAAEVGYVSRAHFARAYRAEFGTAPAAQTQG